jgi:hypothetical protein
VIEMGCKYCSSGMGELCEGPDSMDDIEAGCTCDCHNNDEEELDAIGETGGLE